MPYSDYGGKLPYCYLEFAIERVLQAVAAKRSRILLTLATGTGKTFIAFQIAWKLFQSRWNLGREPDRRPRILFLAVRDLINQMKRSRDPNYCPRVTANDGELGDQHLRDFQDNEQNIPTILTTSQELSTCRLHFAYWALDSAATIRCEYAY